MAIIGSLTSPLQPLVSRAKTSLDAWNTLASTYGKPSRGHIKQLKDQLKRSTKGDRSIDDYLQVIKTKADQLALLGKPLDHEDFVEYILDGLSDDYRVIVDQIHGRDTPPTFEELHEKLVNREATILCSQPVLAFPPTAHAINHRHRNVSRPPPRASGPRNPADDFSTPRSSSDSRTLRPYLGRCQACGTQGHSAKRCPQFRMVSNSGSSSPMYGSSPRAYTTTLTTSELPLGYLTAAPLIMLHLILDSFRFTLRSPVEMTYALVMGLVFLSLIPVPSLYLPLIALLLYKTFLSYLKLHIICSPFVAFALTITSLWCFYLMVFR